jgi:hypothetical protein
VSALASCGSFIFWNEQIIIILHIIMVGSCCIHPNLSWSMSKRCDESLLFHATKGILHGTSILDLLHHLNFQHTFRWYPTSIGDIKKEV